MKEEVFSISAAQLLISSGKHRNVLRRTSLLQNVDLNSLVTSEQKMCFYGNLLTLMGIHMWLYAVERGVSRVVDITDNDVKSYCRFISLKKCKCFLEPNWPGKTV